MNQSPNITQKGGNKNRYSFNSFAVKFPNLSETVCAVELHNIFIFILLIGVIAVNDGIIVIPYLLIWLVWIAFDFNVGWSDKKWQTVLNFSKCMGVLLTHYNILI